MKPPIKNTLVHDFQTPPEAILPLLQFIDPNWVVWECASGNGNLVKAFEERGYQCKGTDIKSDLLFDFRYYIPDFEYNCIITNPPYNLKQDFLIRAYEIGKPFAFLLPLTTFDTGKRQELFNKYGVEVIFFDKRIHFETPNKVENSKSWFSTAWFTWGLNIGKELTFVKYGE